MFARRGKFARAECAHDKTITVRNAGIERNVCESCGHVSFRAEDVLSGEVSRDRFEREVERTRSTVG
jgi:NAD-dependent SIR2 family protein deacetylase